MDIFFLFIYLSEDCNYLSGFSELRKARHFQLPLRKKKKEVTLNSALTINMCINFYLCLREREYMNENKRFFFGNEKC
jgi:hypothetical protein